MADVRLVHDPIPFERDFARRAREGHPGAWGEFVDLHQPGLFRLAAAILRHEEDARDVLQDVFRQAFQGLEELARAERPDLWLRRIVINHSRDLLRKRKVRLAAVEDLSRMPEGSAGPEELLTGREARDRVLRALESLALEFREALVAHLLEDRSYRELAEILGLSVNAVRIRVHRGLVQLRALLKEDPR